MRGSRKVVTGTFLLRPIVKATRQTGQARFAQRQLITLISGPAHKVNGQVSISLREFCERLRGSKSARANFGY